jgi:hypothetical protein
VKKSLFCVLFVLAILLSACGAAAATLPALSIERQAISDSKDVMSMAAIAPASANGPTTGAAGFSTGEPPSAAQDRIVILNGSRTLVVNDPSDAARKIADLARAKGGWVVNSNISQSSYGANGEKYYAGDITIRVPADSLDQTLAEIEALAVEVKSRQLSGQDVTAEYTDLQSRLRNLQASQSRLYAIMEKAEDTVAVTAVEVQLRQVEEQIEVLQGQINYYEESAKYSSVTVSLEPYIPSQPIEIGGWHPDGVAKQALEDLVRGLQELVDVIIRLGICGLPVLLILALVALPFVLITRALIRRGKTPKA